MLCNLYTDHYIYKKLTVEDYGIVISKDKPELQKQFNEHIARLKENGDLANHNSNKEFESATAVL